MSEAFHQVLARKWRPQRFEDVLGQRHVTTTLLNGLSLGRLAHAYLFCGPRGVGKTSTARILAKAVNCTKAPGGKGTAGTGEPCNACEACASITEGRALDVIEIDAASHGRVDEARDLRERVPIPPAVLRRKVYIIDEVHQMSRDAFDALLKTLEEPPPHVLFVLATTESDKVPATIVSRCQKYDFRRLNLRELTASLQDLVKKEKFSISPEAIAMVAEAADGSVRDSLSLLDQVAGLAIPKSGAIGAVEVGDLLGAVRYEVLDGFATAARTRDTAKALEGVAELADRGADYRRVLLELLEHFRRLMLCRAHAQPGTILDLPDSSLARLRTRADEWVLEDLIFACRHLALADDEMRRSSHPRLVLELTLVRLCALPSGSGWNEILARIGAAPFEPGAARPAVAPAVPVRPYSPPPAPAAERSAKVSPPPQRRPAEDAGVPVPAVSDIEDAPVGGEFQVESVRDSWRKVLEQIGKRKNPSAEAVFENATVAAVEGQDVRLAFNNAMALERAAHPEMKKLVETILGEFFPTAAPRISMVSTATSVPAAVKARAIVPGQARVPTPQEIEEAKKDPVVRAALDLFGGEIVEIRS